MKKIKKINSLKNENETLSLKLMINWLQEHSINKKIMNSIEKQLGNLNIYEICNICNETSTSPPLSYDYITCKNNHSLNRCVLTLIPIISSGNYICNGCKRFAMNDSKNIWWIINNTNNNVTTCPFCDCYFEEYIPF